MAEIWQEIKITINTIEPAIIDLVNYYLGEAGAIGTEITYAQGYLENHPNLFGEIPEELPEDYLTHPAEVIGYVEEDLDLEALKKALDTIESLEYDISLSDLEAENWQQNWMKYYKPERISRFLSIVPEWEDYTPEANEQVIYMDPGVAFGTGNHPTTRLSAQALELVMRGGERVLDVGTGTGILSFIAGTFGAVEVLGMDLDPQAVNAANNNLITQANHPIIGQLIQDQRIKFIENNLLNGIDTQAEIIVANILPHILVNMFDDAKSLLVDDGYLILGGILQEKAEFIEENLKNHQLKIYLKSQMNEWVNYIVIKGDTE